MKTISEQFKFRYFFNLILMVTFMLGMLTLAPADATARPVPEQGTIGGHETNQFDPLRPVVPERGLDPFGRDGSYFQDGRPADWVDVGGNFEPPFAVPGQMPDNDPGPDWESEAAIFPRPESHQRRQSPMDLLFNLNKVHQRETYINDIGREVDLNAESPRIEVVPMWNEITGYNWSPNTAVTLTIGSNNWTENTDEYGHVYFYVGSIQLSPGLEVVMSDGTFISSHTIKNLVVTEIDLDLDTVSGTAAPGSEIEVDTCDYYDYYDCYWLYPIADGSGNWQANFFGLVDIITESYGRASEYDEQGNSTILYWTVPDPKISVYPVWDYVYGHGWSPNTLIELYIDSTLVASETVSSWGDVNFNLHVDVVVGQAVMLTDGTYTRTHTVTNLAVTVIDQDLNAVSGTAKAGSEVHIDGDNGYDWEEVTVTVNASEQWTANFTYLDIDTGSYGYARQYDAAGNSTNIYWYIPDPYIDVYPLGDYIFGFDWLPNSQITLTIGVNHWEKLSDSQGEVYFDLHPFDIQPGQIVEMWDGVNSRIYIVKNVAVTNVDQETDIVRGTTDPGHDVTTYACDDYNCHWIYPTADGSGNWSANFSGFVDIAPGSFGWASEIDQEGNATNVYWEIPDPYINVYPLGDYVYGYKWSPNSQIILKIQGNQWTRFSNSDGIVYFNILPFDLQPGQEVEMTDGISSRKHVVKNVTVTEVDQEVDIVTGKTDPGHEIRTYACDEFVCHWLYPTADGLGNWSADFAGFVDIAPSAYGWAYEYDTGRNSTRIRWYIPDPTMSIYPEWDRVYGYDWPPYTTITLSIGTKTWNSISSYNGWVSFYTDTFDIASGQTVTMSGGGYSKAHNVRNLTVTMIDEDNDTISGTSASGAQIIVMACDYYCTELSVTADASGVWTANFSTIIDIAPGTSGSASQYDADGDSTWVTWYLREPHFVVYPQEDRVYGHDWIPNNEVTLTIDTVDWIEVSSSWGSVYFYTESFDIQPGQTVYMTDGTDSRTHIVTNLSVTGIFPDTNKVCGTAEPGSQIEVGTWETYYYYGSSGVADASGDWCADFSGIFDITTNSAGEAYQYDETGNSTNIYWYVVDPKLTVYPDFDFVSGYQWPANTEITLTIGDAREAWTNTSSYSGYVYFDLEDFDILPGQLVEMRDESGTYILTHTVRNITVTDIDTNTDTVRGTADPTSALVACAVAYVNQTYNQVCLDINADGSGKWQADFSGSINITVGTYGYVYQLDENNNSTLVFWEVEGDFQVFLPLVTK
jgi:hypothetical protein